MEFTERELELLSDGLCRLMRDAGEASRLVYNAETNESINSFCAEIRALHTKICNHMEG